MSTTILAIDLGKFNSVLCWYEPISRSTVFRTVKTTPEELRKEFNRQAVAQVVFEACSQAGWVHDLCEELGLPALVASTNGAAWQWKRIKRKTDHDDALKIARLAAVGEIDRVQVPPRAIRQWRSLIGLRKRIVSERVRGQNRIRGLLVCQGLPAPVFLHRLTATPGRLPTPPRLPAVPLTSCHPSRYSPINQPRRILGWHVLPLDLLVASAAQLSRRWRIPTNGRVQPKSPRFPKTPGAT